MAKVKTQEKQDRFVVKAKTTNSTNLPSAYQWWLANSKKELAEQLLSTVTYIKQTQQYRYRQAAIYARLYGNMPLFNFAGSNLNKMSVQTNLPVDRPTMNVIQSCVDTLTSRITQSRPRPVFLTDNGDYHERTLAKQMNTFINGELYQTDAYEMGELLLRDAAVLGTGCAKIYETPDHRVGLERRLLTELMVDPNDALYGTPRQLFELKLMDKSVLQDYFPQYKSMIASAEQAFPDNSSDSQMTIADQVMVAEAWHLPSGKDSGDGRHVIVCTSGVILDEEWNKNTFPFVFMDYSPRIHGMWGQGLAEQLMGTQMQINQLLMTITQSINLVGVPRVFLEAGSKVLKTAINNMIGAIITYQGTKPIYEVAPCVPVEMYSQLERLVQYAYQQSGISALSAAAQKPAGLNSGTAIRSYDDLQSDRFASLSKRYDRLFIKLAYQVIDKAKDICEEQGSYQTVYPNKNSTKEVNLPESKRLDDPFVIQCYDASSLPRDPAGRLQTVTEMMQSGILSPSEGRRLLDYPDIEQVDKLATAGEERILKILDDIIESGKYSPPDPFMDLDMALEKVTQYYNLYEASGLEESKAQKLRDFFTQVQALKMAAMPDPAAPAPGAAPIAVPQAAPVSDLLPVGNQQPSPQGV